VTRRDVILLAIAAVSVRLVVPSGLVTGTQLRVSGDGNDAGAGSVPGDLLVDVSVVAAPRDPRVNLVSH
jgi:DnaJ-class molecular chaperone